MTKPKYKIIIKKKVIKNITKLPNLAQKKLQLLLDDLRDHGPVQLYWPNYSKLDKNNYHCHLGYKWVACWQHHKNTITIEVYYVGSRQNAPY